MWVSNAFKDWFIVSNDTINGLRTELAALKAELTATKTALITSNVMSDFLRMQVNTLQLERAALMEKAYNIHIPAPEIARRTSSMPSIPDFSFEDIGDAEAKKHGLPLHDIN